MGVAYKKLNIEDKSSRTSNSLRLNYRFATAEAYDRFATFVYDDDGWFFLVVSETDKDYMLSSAALRRIVLGRTRS